MAKKIDPNYISSENHEIRTINKLYGTPAPLIYFMINEASKGGKRKVWRHNLYHALELLGYKKVR